MSREIKFRVWDKELKQFNSPKVHHLEKFNGMLKIVLNSDIQKISGNDRFTIQQYTGLKDHNGVEIVEGDIVHYVFDGASYPREAEDKLLICKWDQGNAWFVFDETLDKHVDGYYWLEIKGRCEVIGNIFENLELI
jgi:uncharacterized phage protein (TIGR01671 family)